MKATIELSEMQVLKVCSLYPATDEQTEAVLDAVRRTPEIDLTEKCRKDSDFAQLALSVCAFAISILVEKFQAENKSDGTD